MSSPTQRALHNAKLQDIPTSALREAIVVLRGRSSPLTDAEYGVRSDDGALVFHFYPPGWALQGPVEWKDWYGFRDRLERAILAHFPPPQVEAGYVPELQSFWVIARRSRAFDETALVESFFRELEAESQTASETKP